VTFTVAVAGTDGCAVITASADTADVQPDTSVTVKLYVPAASPDMVVLVVFPDIAPGLIVQLPAGKLLSITLPVGSEHVGCVIVPTVGADNTAGCALITTFGDAPEVQPDASVTVKLYVPAASPEIVVLAVFPAIAPGLTVQVPAGSPLITTLPVVTAHVG
jgi:hypothetical protein